MAGNKPWQRGAARRRQEVLPRRRVLIVCEDEKSSRYYFESFPVDRHRAEVVAVGTGLNTDRLVEQAIDLVSRESQKGTPYGDVWCVFDSDPRLQNYLRFSSGNQRFSERCLWQCHGNCHWRRCGITFRHLPSVTTYSGVRRARRATLAFGPTS